MSSADIWRLFLESTTKCVYSECPTICYVNEDGALCNTQLTITTLNKMGSCIIRKLRSLIHRDLDDQTANGALYKDLDSAPEIYRLGILNVFFTKNAVELLKSTPITKSSGLQWSKKSKIDRSDFEKTLESIILSMHGKGFDPRPLLGKYCGLSESQGTGDDDQEKEGDEGEGDEILGIDDTRADYEPDTNFKHKLRPILFAENMFFVGENGKAIFKVGDTVQIVSELDRTSLDRMLDEFQQSFVPYFGNVVDQALRMYSRNIGATCIGEAEITEEGEEEETEKRITFNDITAFGKKGLKNTVLVNADFKRIKPGCSIVNTGKNDSHAITFGEAMKMLEAVFVGISYTGSDGNKKRADPFKGREFLEALAKDYVKEARNATVKPTIKTAEEFIKLVKTLVKFDRLKAEIEGIDSSTLHICDKKADSRGPVKLGEISIDILAVIVVSFAYKLKSVSAIKYVKQTIITFIHGVSKKGKLGSKPHKTYRISNLVCVLMNVLLKSVQEDVKQKSRNRLTAPSEQARNNVSSALGENDDS